MSELFFEVYALRDVARNSLNRYQLSILVVCKHVALLDPDFGVLPRLPPKRGRISLNITAKKRFQQRTIFLVDQFEAQFGIGVEIFRGIPGESFHGRTHVDAAQLRQ